MDHQPNDDFGERDAALPTDDVDLSALPALYRRLSRKIETGKAIQLSPDDLALFVVVGAYEAVQRAANEEMKRLAKARLDQRGRP